MEKDCFVNTKTSAFKKKKNEDKYISDKSDLKILTVRHAFANESIGCGLELVYLLITGRAHRSLQPALLLPPGVRVKG